MTDGTWLIEEVHPVDAVALAEIERSSGPPFGFPTRGGGSAPPLAITLHDVVVHDVRKWFGAANIRIDALVVHGPIGGSERSIYQPRTFRFSDVRDGQTLSIDTGGLIIFWGVPRHFIDLHIVVSRDRSDSDTLDALLTGAAKSDAVVDAVRTIGSLALAAGPAAVIPAALTGAAALGDLAYQLVRAVSGNSLGLYRGSWLQIRDAFGVGRHPGDRDAFHLQDISFRYEIAIEAKRQST